MDANSYKDSSKTEISFLCNRHTAGRTDGQFDCPDNAHR